MTIRSQSAQSTGAASGQRAEAQRLARSARRATARRGRAAANSQASGRSRPGEREQHQHRRRRARGRRASTSSAPRTSSQVGDVDVRAHAEDRNGSRVRTIDRGERRRPARPNHGAPSR